MEPVKEITIYDGKTRSEITMNLTPEQKVESLEIFFIEPQELSTFFLFNVLTREG